MTHRTGPDHGLDIPCEVFILNDVQAAAGGVELELNEGFGENACSYPGLAPSGASAGHEEVGGGTTLRGGLSRCRFTCSPPYFTAHKGVRWRCPKDAHRRRREPPQGANR